jgi:hypothetical protein
MQVTWCVRVPNKKLERKKKRLSTSLSTIVVAINNFTHVAKDIELKKIEMTKIHHISNVIK